MAIINFRERGKGRGANGASVAQQLNSNRWNIHLLLRVESRITGFLTLRTPFLIRLQQIALNNTFALIVCLFRNWEGSYRAISFGAFELLYLKSLFILKQSPDSSSFRILTVIDLIDKCCCIWPLRSCKSPLRARLSVHYQPDSLSCTWENRYEESRKIGTNRIRN